MYARCQVGGALPWRSSDWCPIFNYVADLIDNLPPVDREAARFKIAQILSKYSESERVQLKSLSERISQNVKTPLTSDERQLLDRFRKQVVSVLFGSDD